MSDTPRTRGPGRPRMEDADRPACPECGAPMVRYGTNRNGQPSYWCRFCKRSRTLSTDRPPGRPRKPLS